MAFKVLQNTKINAAPFVFTNSATVIYPLSPLITAEFYEPNAIVTLKIRATLYINSEDPNHPVVQIPKEADNSLKLYFDYNFSDTTPESCDVWYVEVDYTSPTVETITTIVSYLKDIDPDTSRGTSTEVAYP
jgi:hypothetical protein